MVESNDNSVCLPNVEWAREIENNDCGSQRTKKKNEQRTTYIMRPMEEEGGGGAQTLLFLSKFIFRAAKRNIFANQNEVISSLR